MGISWVRDIIRDLFSPGTDATWMREAGKDGEGGENVQTKTGCERAGNQGTSRSPCVEQ